MNFKYFGFFILFIFCIGSVSLSCLSATTYSYDVNKFVKSGDEIKVIREPNEGQYKCVAVSTNLVYTTLFDYTDFSFSCDKSQACSNAIVSYLNSSGCFYLGTSIIKSDFLGVVKFNLDYRSGFVGQNHQVLHYYIEVNGINLN